MTAIDVIVFVWLAIVVFVAYVGLPWLMLRVCPSRRVRGIAPLAATLIATVGIGTVALSLAGLINPVTVFVLHLGWAAVVFLRSHPSLDAAAERLVRLMVAFDLRARTVVAPVSRLRNAAAQANDAFRAAPRPALVACAALAVTVVALYILPVLREARLFHPEAYVQLFTVRRMLAGSIAPHIASPALGWVAALAALASVDAARVVHMLPALLTAATLPLLLIVVRRRTGSLDAALAAAFIWLIAGSGFAAETPWGDLLTRAHAAPGELLGAIVLLTMLGTRRSGEPVLAALLLCCAPAMTPAGAAVLLAPSRWRLPFAATAWLVVAVAGHVPAAPEALHAVAVTLPIALALSAAVVFRAMRLPARLPEPAAAQVFGLAVLVAGAGIFPPHLVIERDVVAREALRVLTLAGGRPVTLAGDVSPLLRGLGGASIETFPELAECAGGGRRCDDARQPMFVFVDKRPLVPAAFASDRDRLITADAWARTAPGVRILHDDDTLRVYYRPPTVF